MKKILLIGILSVLLISFSFAKLEIQEPEKIYNLGDKLHVFIEGIVGEESGNLNVDLICERETINLLKIPARGFSSSFEQTYSLPYKFLNSEDLEIEDITKILGDCKLKTTLNKNEYTTQSFLITKELNLEVKTNKGIFNPGEQVAITLESSKKNDNIFRGFYNLTGLIDKTGTIDSMTEIKFYLPYDIEAGDHEIEARVYDYNYEREIQNEETEGIKIRINQVPTKLTVGFSGNTFLPEEEITITGEIRDQTNVEIKKELTLQIKSPLGKIEEYNLKSGEFLKINLPSNAPSGGWEVTSNYQGISSEVEEFILEGVPKLDYVIEDNRVIISNIGNALYENHLEIGVEDYQKRFYVKLNPGESREFSLAAPDGNYNIVISGEKDTFTGSTFLTGNAISINDKKSEVSWYMWAIILAVLVLVGVSLTYIIYKKKKEVKPKKEKKSRKEKKKDMLMKYQEKQGMIREKKKEKEFDFSKAKLSAESTLVLKGTKSNTSIIAIDVKNYPELKPLTKENLYNIINTVLKGKGVFEYKEGFIFILFNPMITRTYHNEILAVQAAMEIIEELENYNKKYKEKIKYGLGVNSGDLIVSKEKDKLKYTGVEDTIPLSKKIASLRGGELLVSENIRKKMLRTLKTEEVDKINTKSVYRVKEIKNVAENEEKLKEILKRMKGN